MGVRIQPEQIFRRIENNFLYFIHKVNGIESKNKQFKPYNGVAQDRAVFENSTTASDKHVNGEKKSCQNAVGYNQHIYPGESQVPPYNICSLRWDPQDRSINHPYSFLKSNALLSISKGCRRGCAVGLV